MNAIASSFELIMTSTPCLRPICRTITRGSNRRAVVRLPHVRSAMIALIALVSYGKVPRQGSDLIASITIRQLDESLNQQTPLRAGSHGRSRGDVVANIL